MVPGFYTLCHSHTQSHFSCYKMIIIIMSSLSPAATADSHPHSLEGRYTDIGLTHRDIERLKHAYIIKQCTLGEIVLSII